MDLDLTDAYDLSVFFCDEKVLPVQVSRVDAGLLNKGDDYLLIFLPGGANINSYTVPTYKKVK